MACSARRTPKSGQFWMAASMMMATQIMQGIGAVNYGRVVVGGWVTRGARAAAGNRRTRVRRPDSALPPGTEVRSITN